MNIGFLPWFLGEGEKTDIRVALWCVELFVMNQDIKFIIMGLMEVNRMLVVLGLTHYCASTYTLSTWSSSTLL